jgi:ATP-dependent helicase HrpA
VADPSFPFRLDFPPALPISARAEEIVAAIQTHPVVILAGETGSGKTTQIPKMCLAAGRGTAGRIACTQPRRVAALSISRRVAEELGVGWGREVGCKIRFNDQTTPATVIKFLTDGMLLAEVQGDPLLREYDTIIIDEAHERSLNIDFLLGHLRNLRFRRPELKIVITSATIDTEMFSRAFDDAPVLRVEGRTFPVEVIYAPLDALGRDWDESSEAAEPAEARTAAKAEALHYIDGAVEAVERILRESESGDVLIFMPSERDIRETTELLEGRVQSRRRGGRPEIVPLFGRLSNADQQRVFAPSAQRKIVIATNIAETSLTIPGIRFVIDTGLARLSRYSPQARTRRLPIEPVAQSSADQRKGRCGRVADGVCIRLYAEKDYLERPRFTQPEIQRANLADVILRLKAFGLGDIERFPFINMPAAKSIRAGYALLEELGALVVPDASQESGVRSRETSSERQETGEERPVAGDGPRASGLPGFSATRELTPLGHELARLPVDPTVGRMILEAREEKALHEVLVIAAGLSIQDPRERPLDKQQQADAAHRRFAHPDSDFLTLLNVWDSAHGEFDRMSQARLRRFCRDHFLSYTRMREWRDIHAQLLETLEARDGFKLTSALDGTPAPASAPPPPPSREKGAAPARPKSPPPDPLAFGTPAYRAIHRSILAGLLGNIARREEEGSGYRATHDRRVNLFPGSVLFTRDDPKKKTSSPAPGRDGPGKGKAPRWILAAEIMETTRLYARTCARLDPAWALELGAHLVRVAHSEPFWNPEQGRVLVKQRTRLYGLELETRAVGYGRINPVAATEIFIREGLVNDSFERPPDFLEHNRRIREEVESLLTRTRDRGYLNLDEAAYRFYADRLMPFARHGRETNTAGGELRGQAVVPLRRASPATAPTGISSLAELAALARERQGTEPDFLRMTLDDLRGPDAPEADPAAFPTRLELDNRALPLAYAYKPGQEGDGVTLVVGVREAEALTPAALDWAVPGHLELKVEHYLRALPKELRRGFVPLGETARSLAGQLAGRDRLTGRRETLTEALAAQIRERFRVAIDPAIWVDKPLPDHLRVRVSVVDDDGREIAAGRELPALQAALHARTRAAGAAVAHKDPSAWQQARARWEKPAQTTWTFGDIPARVPVHDDSGVKIFAFPALRAGTGGVSLRLCQTPEEAAESTRVGLSALLELGLRHDLGWLQRDLRGLRELGALYATLTPLERLQEDAFYSIRRWVTSSDRVDGTALKPGSLTTAAISSEPISSAGLTATAFSAALEAAKADLRGLVSRLVDQLREILELRLALQTHPQPYPGLEKDLGALLAPDFLRTTPYLQLAQFPRYLKAMKARADRWRQNPAKDTERAQQLAPYLKAVAELRADPRAAFADQAEALRWLVEEFRVSLFAQEIGTAEPVSAQKLDRLLADMGRPSVAPDASPKTIAAKRPEPAAATHRPMTAEPAKKAAPLKNLGALDKLFRK